MGQSSVPMSLAPNGAWFFGLKLGRRSCDLVLIDFLGKVIENVRYTYQYPTPEDTVRFAHESVTQLTDKYPATQQQRIAGLGIGIPFQM